MPRKIPQKREIFVGRIKKSCHVRQCAHNCSIVISAADVNLKKNSKMKIFSSISDLNLKSIVVRAEKFAISLPNELAKTKFLQHSNGRQFPKTFAPNFVFVGWKSPGGCSVLKISISRKILNNSLIFGR